MSWFKDRDLERRIEQLEFNAYNDQSLACKVGISAHLPNTFYSWVRCCHSIEIEILLKKMKDDGIDIEKYHIYKAKP